MGVCNTVMGNYKTRIRMCILFPSNCSSSSIALVWYCKCRLKMHAQSFLFTVIPVGMHRNQEDQGSPQEKFKAQRVGMVRGEFFFITSIVLVKEIRMLKAWGCYAETVWVWVCNLCDYYQCIILLSLYYKTQQIIVQEV